MSASKFVKFVLYNPIDATHASVPTSALQAWDGRHFICYDVKDTTNAEYETYFAKVGRYPIGVALRTSDPHVSDAYIPRDGEARTQEELQWLANADYVRLRAEYEEAVSGDWDQPKMPAGALKPIPKFNADWLPTSIKPWVADVARRMGVSVDFAAIGALVTLAGAVGARAQVFPREHDKKWKEVITLSGAVIAPSGKKKTPTWKAFMAPLYELEGEWRREHEALTKAYQTALAAYKRQEKMIEAQNKEEAKAAKKEGREPNLKSPGPTPAPPVPSKRLVLNDSTPEQMHEIAKGNAQGMLYFRDELSSWAAELDMTGREPMRGFFLGGMTGDEERTVDRIGREGGFANITINVFGSFQPSTFINFLNKTENVGSGMLPRFHLLAWPDRPKPRLFPLDVAHDAEAEKRYRQVVRSLAKMRYRQIELHFDAEAQKLFNEFDRNLGEYAERETNEGKAAHLSKYNGAVAKIAALFQLIDLVGVLPVERAYAVNLTDGEKKDIGDTEPPIPPAIQIDAAHFRKAWSFFGYLEKHMHRVYDSRQSGTQVRMGLLVEHLKAGDLQDGFTARDILRKDWAGLGQRSTTTDAIEDSLEGLQALNWVRYIPQRPGTATVGRPVKKWNVNPLIATGDIEDSPQETDEDQEVEYGATA